MTIVVSNNITNVQVSDSAAARADRLLAEQAAERATGVVPPAGPILRVQSIAYLRTNSVSTSSTAYVTSYYSDHPEYGGSGFFYGATGGSYTDNGGTVIIPNGSVGSTGSSAWLRFPSDVVNVREFGARGDGSTDDTAIVQRAISTGKRIYFPAGNYLISSSLSLATSGQELFGEGYTSNLILNSSSAGIGISGAVENVKIRDFKVSSTRTDNTLIYGESLTTMGVISNIYFSGGARHVKLVGDVGSGTYGFHIQNCVFYNAADKAIYIVPDTFSYSQAHYITDCEFFGNVTHLYATSGSGYFVSHCRFERKTISASIGAGIHIDNCAKFVLRDTYIEENNDVNVVELGSNNHTVTIDGNIFSVNNYLSSVNMRPFVCTQDVKGLSFTNNVIFVGTSTSYGSIDKVVDFRGSTNLICTGNRIYEASSPAQGVTYGFYSTCGQPKAVFAKNLFQGTFTTATIYNHKNNGMQIKAWASYNGSTQTLGDSENIASVTRTAAGNYLFTLSTALDNDQYSVIALCENPSNGSGTVCVPSVTSKTSGDFRIQIAPTASGGGGLAEATILSVMVAGSAQ